MKYNKPDSALPAYITDKFSRSARREVIRNGFSPVGCPIRSLYQYPEGFDPEENLETASRRTRIQNGFKHSCYLSKYAAKSDPPKWPRRRTIEETLQTPSLPYRNLRWMSRGGK